MTQAGITHFLRENDIVVPRDFLSDARDGIHSGYELPTLDSLRGIMKVANFWRPYIEEDTFSLLVLKLVREMIRIHTCAVGTYENLDFSYIRNIEGLTFKDSLLPSDTLFSITMGGTVWYSQGKGSSVREYLA